MLKVYSDDDAERWDALVRSFAAWDVYYLHAYAHSFMLHGDGEPRLIFYEDENTRLCYVVMQRDIADDPVFSGNLEHGTFFDFETPYGYGGPLSDGAVPDHSQQRFLHELTEFCKGSIIAQFVRFHPLLGTQRVLPLAIETRYLRDTIYIDTADLEGIAANMDSKNRNMIRKARKCGISVVRRPIEDYSGFLSMYKETMERDHAEEYYTFNTDYFNSLNTIHDHACIFYAMLNDIPVSGAIMLYTDRDMHYHLSGTHYEYRSYAPGNLLLYEAACWANSLGIKRLHLGGGLSPDDSLFGFKKQFNKTGRLPYMVGRTIFDREKYDALNGIRKALNPGFSVENSFMLQYRKP